MSVQTKDIIHDLQDSIKESKSRLISSALFAIVSCLVVGCIGYFVGLSTIWYVLLLWGGPFEIILSSISIAYCKHKIKKLEYGSSLPQRSQNTKDDRLLDNRERESQPVDNEIHHPILGLLRFDDDFECWKARARNGDDVLNFAIAGTEEPDSRLINHALDILSNCRRFRAMMDEFLRSEIGRLAGYEREIEQLTIDEVCLFWPDRPDDGMIYFNCPNDIRVWRCDYIGGKPRCLGFDG